jgi:hypothetical protein
LEALQAAGHTLTDIAVCMMRPGWYRIWVYTAESDDHHEFHIECDRPTMALHHPAAVEFTGFGPRGLGNLIHMEVTQRAADAGIPREQFRVLLSEACWQRVQPDIQHWSGYGYTFHLSPALSGFSFVVQPPLAAE